ncbi:hypothetical protein [Undibacterium pigrum]|uniref:hypothetical protein n=1 Tax=Undibacterium pigrum TaxID=401470 RepID=UPI00147631D2|nr:hypothetical protein [Undibacterium pigrum]
MHQFHRSYRVFISYQHHAVATAGSKVKNIRFSILEKSVNAWTVSLATSWNG